MNGSSKYAMTLVVAVGVAVMMTAAAVSTSTFSAYAEKKPPKCDSSDSPPFKDFPGESGPTGNPHTCDDPHDDEDNPLSGNPHNTDDD